MADPTSQQLTVPSIATIPVRQSVVGSEDPYELIETLADIRDDLVGRGAYMDHELPAFLILNHRLTVYRNEVGNGGHEQFVGNRGWSAALQQELTDALGAIGAESHLQVFCDFAAYLKESPDRLVAVRARGGFDDSVFGKVDPFIKSLDQSFYTANRIKDLMAWQKAWLRREPAIEPVPDPEWKARMVTLFDANPMRDARFEAKGWKPSSLAPY